MKKRFSVEGMTCASCARSVESYLGAQSGVYKAEVNFADQSVLLEWDEQEHTSHSLADALNEIGYGLVVPDASASDKQKAETTSNESTLKSTLWAGALSVPVLLLAMFLGDAVPFNKWIQALLSAPVVFWFGRRFFIGGFKRIRHLQTNMDTLVALSTGIAFLYSSINLLFPHLLNAPGEPVHVYFESATIIIFFILLGKHLEELAKDRTRDALKELMNLQPQKALLYQNGQMKEVPLDQIGSGDEIVVQSGMKVPVDGKVLSGYSFVEESMLTGEPIAVEKTKGAPVFAGTVNKEGTLHVVAHSVGTQTRLASIVENVRNAQGSKAPVQDLADKISTIFVPIVMFLSLITFAAWLWIGGLVGLDHAVSSMVAVLIIACPCALGLATPAALMVGMGKGAQNGILIQHAEALQRADEVTDMIFDKTGTLTQGKPRLQEEKWFEQSSELKDVLYSIEEKSAHPLAKSIVVELKEKDRSSVEIQDFKTKPGKGVEAQANGVWFGVGSPAWRHEVLAKKGDEDTSITSDGSVVEFFDRKKILARFFFSDEIVAEAENALNRLRQLGLELHLLSGDREDAVKAVAQKLGISHVNAGAEPSHKRSYVERLQAKGKKVVMIGDGINDAEALAQADVSIAIGTGTDVAMDVAQVTLVRQNLFAVVDALSLSKATMRVIRQNLAWAFGYNILAIPLAAGAFIPLVGMQLNPMIAGAAMAFSSVSVVLNSLRLKGWKTAEK